MRLYTSGLHFRERRVNSFGSEHYGAIRQAEIPALTLLRCMTLGNLLKLPGVSISICKMKTILILTLLCNFEMVCLKHLEQGLDITDAL